MKRTVPQAAAGLNSEEAPLAPQYAINAEGGNAQDIVD